jgi:protocatechuate 3,4-dioxygenase beta subunit
MRHATFTMMLAGLLLLGLQPASALDLSVTITSSPLRWGQVGVPYVYDVNAVSSDSNATLTYELRSHTPDGMTIDAATGLIQWTPASAGRFEIHVRVKARLNDNVEHEAEAEQEYGLRITTNGGSPSGTMTGTVQNEAGDGIRPVEIEVFDGSGEESLFEGHTDSTGAYRITGIFPGTYLVKADPSGMTPYREEWFDNVTRRSLATPVVIAESASVVINFVLAPRDTHNSGYSVSGVVRGQNGTPLPGAKVTFARHHDDDDDHGDDDGNDDHGGDNRLTRIGNNSNHGHSKGKKTSTYTDSLGAYHLQLRPWAYRISASKEGYQRQWWNHQTSSSAADSFVVVSDTTGIDFDLSLLSAPPQAAGPRVRLKQNYPNPFNPTTSIGFVLPSSGKVRLTVYNMLGQSMATLVDGELSAGDHRVDWRADGAASGLYFYRVEFGGTTEVRRMTLVR